MDKTKVLKILKIILPVLILGILTYAVYRIWFRSPVAKDDQTRIVKVAKGDIAPTLVVSGTVASENEVDLNFKSGGELEAIYVEAGDSVSTGQELARIDYTDLQGELRVAEANLKSANAQMRQLKKSTPSEIEIQEIAVSKALASLENARENLQNVEASTSQDITSAQLALDNAKKDMDWALTEREEALEEWEDLVKQYEHPVFHIPNYTPSQQKEVDAAKATADSAYDKYMSAEAQYETAQQSLNAAQLKAQSQMDSAENEVSQTEAQHQTALVQLEDMKAGPTSDDRTIQQAAVTQAEENYNAADRDFDNALLTSPIDGTVISINGNVGEEVSSGASGSNPAFTVVADLAKLKVTAAVDQADIPKVDKGQDVTISLDAFPDREFKGKVTNIDPNPVVTQNVVTYNISVTIDNPDPKTQLSMGATLEIDLGMKENVLVVPNLAVRSVDDNKVISKVIDGIPTDVRVEVGLSDDENTEITSGLEEGDEIVVGVFTGTQGAQGNSQKQGGFGLPGMSRPGGGR